MAEQVDQAWSEGTWIGLTVATLICPLVGIIAGFSGMSSPRNKDNAQGLLIWGIIAAIGWFVYWSSL